MTHRHALQSLFAAAGASLLLHLLPLLWPPLAWFAWPLMLLSTVFHELGHGIAAVLAGGSFEALRIYADGSGVATTLSDGSRGMRAVIAAGGPLAPPLVALGLFVAARKARGARAALWLLGFALALAVALWVRNLFGVGLVLLLAAAFLLTAWKASARVAQAMVCFLAIQLSLAAFSRADYLFTSDAVTGLGTMPSDTAQIAQALWLPYWFWGAAIAALSLAVLILGMIAFARALRSTQFAEDPSINIRQPEKQSTRTPPSTPNTPRH